MDIKNIKTICVAGWSKTGIALTRMLLSLGKKVKITEIRQKSCFLPQLIKDFQLKGANFEFGGHSEDFISNADLVVLSPGIDFFNSQLAKIVVKNRLAYCGELEFVSYFSKAKIIAITGTNGKTTTAYLTYRLLKKKNKKVYLGGNIGRPFSDFVLDTQKGDLIVLEVSSFQLETVLKFKPYVAVLLNIKPDHLDRHKSFDNYLKTKMKIFQNQQNNDWAIVHKNNNLFKLFSSQINSKIIYFGNEFSNENLSAVYRIGKIFGATKTDCLSLFSQCRRLPHRQQLVKVVDQIKFINDSKSTNPASTCFAVKSMQSPIILIAGGKDKGFSYSSVANYARKIKKVNLIGQAADKIKKELNNKIKCQKFNSLKDALLSSSQEAVAGDVVLFSPMCSSFDMFANYKKRGQKFIELVGQLHR
jgi:UDP-N-acetylmuramoylalanine--D-glutamate ligase